MNEKLLNHEMYFNMLDVKFKQLMEYKNCFRSEILESESADLLMKDTRHYLCIQKGVTNFFQRIENYKK